MARLKLLAKPKGPSQVLLEPRGQESGRAIELKKTTPAPVAGGGTGRHGEHHRNVRKPIFGHYVGGGGSGRGGHGR